MTVNFSYGQINSLYLLHEVPQTLKMNPAIGYKCKSFIEMPLFSEVMVNVGNNLFTYNDLINQNDDTGNYFIDFDEVRRNAGRNNRLFLSNTFGLLGGGIEWRDFYLSADIRLQSYMALGAPRAFLNATDGNWDIQNDVPRDLDFGNTYLTGNTFTRISVAVSTDYSPNLRVGARLSYLQGAFNVRTKSSDIFLDTDDNPLILNVDSDHEIQTSFPAQINYNNNNRVAGLDFSNSFANVFRDFIFNNNRGVAFDVGMVYQYSENMQISASIVDLGFIRWNSNVNSFTENGDFTFDGIDLNQYVADSDEMDILQALQDSIRSNFTVNVNHSAHTSLLPVKTYSGVSYKFNRAFQGGAVLRTDIHDRNIYPSLTFTLMYRPVSYISVVISYSLMNRSFNNVGLGLVAGRNRMQFYAISDIIPLQFAKDTASGLVVPYNLKSINFQFGLNWIFECRDDKAYRSIKYQKICPAYN